MSSAPGIYRLYLTLGSNYNRFPGRRYHSTGEKPAVSSIWRVCCFLPPTYLCLHDFHR
jgi:hypothetical protein